jgi:hypothetical protein
MKIAILLSGQPRQIKIGHESLKFYTEKYDCDVFIHTWFDEQFPSSVYNDMLELFKPKKILIENQITFDKTGAQDPRWRTTLQNLLSMYYSIFMANQLKSLYEEECEFKYDFVIRMRTDIKLKRPIEIEKIEKGKIALYNWTETGYNDRGVSDIFAIGESSLMDVYSNVYSNIPFYLNDDKTYNINDTKMRPEYVLKHHLKTANKLSLQFFWHGDVSDPSWYLIR